MGNKRIAVFGCDSKKAKAKRAEKPEVVISDVATRWSARVFSRQKGQKNQRRLYQMLQHDGVREYFQAKMQIFSQTRKSDKLKRQSTNKRIHRTLDAPLILGDRQNALSRILPIGQELSSASLHSNDLIVGSLSRSAYQIVRAEFRLISLTSCGRSELDRICSTPAR